MDKNRNDVIDDLKKKLDAAENLADEAASEASHAEGAIEKLQDIMYPLTNTQMNLDDTLSVLGKIMKVLSHYDDTHTIGGRPPARTIH